MRRRVLVTGGCGFIGTHVTSCLLNHGYEVHVVDNMSGCDPSDFYTALEGKKIRQVPAFLINAWEQQADSDDPDVVVFTGDFASGDMLRRVLQVKYDAVIHLAAEPRVLHTVNFPVSSYDNNFQSSIALFHACAKSSTRLVFASSAAVYGDVNHPCPVAEDMWLNGTVGSPYALQKRQCEETIELFVSLYNLSAISLRFFNVYGEGQKGDSPYSTVIAAWLEKIRSGKPLRLDGDGKQTRDYVHVSDVANACRLALESDETGTSVNVASGVSTSNNEILEQLSKFAEFQVETAPARVGDIKHSLGDTRKALELLNFENVIDIHSGIAALARKNDG